MIAVVQRVTSGSVLIGDRVAGEIGKGLVVLAAIVRDDLETDLKWIAARLAGLRVFPSDKGSYDLDVRQTGGKVLLVSNFTVAADTASGRRPGFSAAMSPDLAKPVFEQFVQLVQAQGVDVQTGEFGADMHVHLTNDGPLTVILDSKRR